MELTKAYREFLQILQQREVAYLIVGAYSVAYYGHSRPTDDLDIWIEGSEANKGRLLKALQDFGFSAKILDSNEVAENGFSHQMRVPLFRKQLGKLKLDLSFKRIHLKAIISGIEFDHCYQRRTEMEEGGQEINLIALEDLVKYKKIKKRPKDKEDIRNLPVLTE